MKRIVPSKDPVELVQVSPRRRRKEEENERGARETQLVSSFVKGPTGPSYIPSYIPVT